MTAAGPQPGPPAPAEAVAVTEGLPLLVVDDNYEFIRMVAELLRLAAGYRVEAAESLAEMRRRLAEGKYAALLLDYHLPDGTGLEALDEVVAAPGAPPVIMVTGAGDERIASEAIKRGAYDYVVKSGDMTKLPRLVGRVISLHAARQAQAAAEARAQYQAWLLDNVADAIIATDEEGHIRFWNQGATHLFGRTAESMLGRRALPDLVADLGGAARAHLQGLFEGSLETEEFELTVPEGRTCWVNARAVALMSEAGEPRGRMVIFRDITDRKLLEGRVQTAHARLFQAARLAAIGELASSVAHEVNNPLTTVLGETQILVRQLEPGSPAHQSAQAVLEAGWRAAAVVERLLKLSSAPAADEDESDLGQTLSAVAELLRSRFEAADIRLDLRLAPDLPRVPAAERDLLDLWTNLLLAARDAAAHHPDGTVSLDAGPTDNGVRVRLTFPGPTAADQIQAGEQPDLQSLFALAVGREILAPLGGGLRTWPTADGRQCVEVSLPALQEDTAKEET